MSESFISKKIKDTFVGFVSDVDHKAVNKTVKKLKKKNENASVEDLCELLIKKKCRHAAAVGAVTAGPSVIPGLGTVTALTIGTGVDFKVTSKLQAELVLEIAQVMAIEMSPAEERNAILLIAGLHAGTSKLAENIGKRIAQKATQHLAEKSISKALPFLGMASSAGINHASTYIIGKRSLTYFQQGPERLEDMTESFRALSGLDERKMISWLSDTGEKIQSTIGSNVTAASDKVIAFKKYTDELYLVKKSHNALSKLGSGLKSGFNAVTDPITNRFKKDEEKEPLLLEAPREVPPLPTTLLSDTDETQSEAATQKDQSPSEWMKKPRPKDLGYSA